MQFLIANSLTDSLYFAPQVRHPHGNSVEWESSKTYLPQISNN